MGGLKLSGGGGERPKYRLNPEQMIAAMSLAAVLVESDDPVVQEEAALFVCEKMPLPPGEEWTIEKRRAAVLAALAHATFSLTRDRCELVAEIKRLKAVRG